MTTPSQNMVERVARVIDPESWAEPEHSTLDGEFWRATRRSTSLVRARAALTAMLDATPGMIEEAVDNVGPIGCCSHSPETALETWQAMIHAALNEGEG